MKNKKIVRKISQGMYVLTTNGGGCIVDAVMQASAGDNPLIAVSVMKNNYTNELMKNNDTFALSVIGKDTNPEIIKTFGFNSMRDINKFENIDITNIDGINIINNTLGYMMCEKIDSIDNDTHTLFIGKVIKSERFSNIKPMTYQYYQEHKDELIKVKTEQGNIAWICTICGYVYYGEDLPDDFICPQCKMPKTVFKKKEK